MSSKIKDSEYSVHLKGYFYPGNDPKPNNIYSIYSKIINHFTPKPNEGCYVCLCEKVCYHSVKSGFPTCPKCSKNIGVEKSRLWGAEQKIVKREGYKRIFKDENEIEELK